MHTCKELSNFNDNNNSGLVVHVIVKYLYDTPCWIMETVKSQHNLTRVPIGHCPFCGIELDSEIDI